MVHLVSVVQRVFVVRTYCHHGAVECCATGFCGKDILSSCAVEGHIVTMVHLSVVQRIVNI